MTLKQKQDPEKRKVIPLKKKLNLVRNHHGNHENDLKYKFLIDLLNFVNFFRFDLKKTFLINIKLN